MAEPPAAGHAHKHGNLPWLDRLAVSVPGYAGYDRRARRRECAFALRDAILRQLHAMHAGLEKAKALCEQHDALREVGSLDRIDGHLHRIIDRVQGFGTRAESFYEAPDIDARRVEPVHGADLALLRKADHLVDHFEHPERTHNFLADVEMDLNEFETILDARALMLQGLNAAP